MRFKGVASVLLLCAPCGFRCLTVGIPPSQLHPSIILFTVSVHLKYKKATLYFAHRFSLW